ncbi:hypothetical protein BTO30_12330 [Domibacillus antri]|uniref:Uncharacterized protein n=1 Tax=Domibacillus antri TaxID=1714264 RepID=A0A1Q8Q3F8_9BACI|nr:hypothetical protein BTO30_12330 [Domibacillus antri]
MGDMAEMVLDGLICERCGSFTDEEESGYAKLCGECERDLRQKQVRPRRFWKKKNPPRQR